MASIKHDFLVYINSKYDISKLLDLVLTRYNRCSFERVIGVILEKECKNHSFFGDIMSYVNIKNFGKYKFSDRDKHNYLPIMKIWSGR